MGDLPDDIKQKIRKEQDEFKRQYMGQPFDVSEQEFKTQGREYRVASIDKQAFLLSNDHNLHRVNVEIENGLIVHIYFD